MLKWLELVILGVGQSCFFSNYMIEFQHYKLDLATASRTNKGKHHLRKKCNSHFSLILNGIVHDAIQIYLIKKIYLE